jgi:hypothetical protein
MFYLLNQTPLLPTSAAKQSFLIQDNYLGIHNELRR